MEEGAGDGEAMVDGNVLVARALARAGFKHMYGVVGIPVTSLAAAALREGVRFLAFRNEQAAGYAAGAAGYLTGLPGLLLTVSGPGCVHGLAGLSNAQINTWPLLMLSGSCDQPDIGKGDFQELDQISVVAPFVKFAAKALSIADIPTHVVSALSAAVSGRPGAAYLDLPSDVLHSKISLEKANTLLAAVETYIPLWERPVSTLPIQPDVAKAAHMLRTAQRPLIVFGKGAAYARAETALREIIGLTRIPFLATPMGKGLVSDTHELSATAARSLVLSQSDVVLVVGARLNWMLHFGEPPRWSPDVQFILVDISEHEIRLRKPALGLVGDARTILMQLKVEIKDEPFALSDRHPWLQKIKTKSAENTQKMAASLSTDVVPFNYLTPLRIIRDAIAAEGSPAPILVSEGANTMDIGRSVLPQTEPRTRLDAGTWGTMGVGLGYAIAAATCCPGRLVVALEGDSGFGFSGFEVETIVRYNLPIVVIVFNNDGVYGGDRRKPEEKTGPYEADPAPTSFVPRARYDTVIEAFGGKGYIVETPSELHSSLTEAFLSRRPTLINVILNPYAGSESGRMGHRN